MSRRVAPAALALALHALLETGWAQSFSVTAEVVEGCAIGGLVPSGSVDLGVLSFGTAPAVHAGTLDGFVTLSGGPIELQCTPGLVLHLSVSAGQHASGGQRHLARDGATGDKVPYALYTSPALSTPIPAAGSIPLIVPGSGRLALPIHGRVTLSGTGLMPGHYRDTLDVTLTW